MCLKEVSQLRLAILRMWTKDNSRQCNKPIDCHFAAVTAVFLKVGKCTSLGGAAEDSNAYRLATCVWAAGIMTAFMHVRGMQSDDLCMHVMVCTTLLWKRCIPDLDCMHNGRDVPRSDSGVNRGYVCAVSVFFGDTGGIRKGGDAREVAALFPKGSMWAWAFRGMAAFLGKRRSEWDGKVLEQWKKIGELKGATCKAGTVSAAKWMGQQIVKVMVEWHGMPASKVPPDVLVECQVKVPQPGEAEKYEAERLAEANRKKAENARKAAERKADKNHKDDVGDRSGEKTKGRKETSASKRSREGDSDVGKNKRSKGLHNSSAGDGKGSAASSLGEVKGRGAGATEQPASAPAGASPEERTPCQASMVRQGTGEHRLCTMSGVAGS